MHPMHDVIVVGAGAAAVAAALQFADDGIVPLVLDVGVSPAETGPRAVGNIYDHRSRQDCFDLFIGERFQGLANLLGPRTVPVKLTTPNSTWVTEDAERLAPLEEHGFHAIQSFARGGLANAWGAGLYAFVERDMEGFPIRAADLAPYVARLTAEIGISGADDDLTPFFGSADGLTAPVRLSRNIAAIYRGYRRRRPLFQRRGMFLGHPRLGIAFEARGDRPAFEYENSEFWQPTPAIYSPRTTLDRLRAQGRVRYLPGLLVRSWTEDPEGVQVVAVDTTTGGTARFAARTLVLAAGAINSARIALQAFSDTTTELELLENPALQVPFVRPRAIGCPLDVSAFGLVQLNLVWDVPAASVRVQGSLMELTSPLRSEFFGGLPFAARDNLALLRYLLPGMVLLQLYSPASCGGRSRLSLTVDDRLKIVGPGEPPLPDFLPELLAAFRRLGVHGHRSLVVRVPMGHAIHYAGTLPLRQDPGPYQCTPGGLLHGTRAVYVADSAAFPSLPAKNMSFAMMTNAMRVAHGISRQAAARR